MEIKVEGDRVWVSEGLNLNNGRYEGFKMDIGMSTSVKEGETPELAIARATKIVFTALDKKARAYRNGRFDHVTINRARDYEEL